MLSTKECLSGAYNLRRREGKGKSISVFILKRIPTLKHYPDGHREGEKQIPPGEITGG